MSRRQPAPNWTDVRIALWDRSRGRCEGCGRHLGNDGAVHHRRLRSRGGDHSLGNLMLLHTPCHTWAHANVTEATGLGWIVSTWGPEPADVEVAQHRTPIGGANHAAPAIRSGCKSETSERNP